MYNLDVNFLKDRGLDAVSKQKVKSTKQDQSVQTKTPFIVGGIVAALLPALAFAYLLLVNNEQATTQAEIQELTSQISQLQSQNDKVKSLQTQLQQVDAELNSLVSVFNQIKPFGVILQEIKDKIPAGVQIKSITQTQSAPTQPQPQGQTATNVEPNKQVLTLTGYASSFEDINDFLLTLQSSDFLNPQKTIINEAQAVDLPETTISEDQRQNILRELTKGGLKDWPSQLRQPELWQKTSSSPTPQNKAVLPKVVSFTITTQLGDKPASELSSQLQLKGGSGLIDRINSLKQKGAISP